MSPEEVIAAAKAAGKTIAVAESCTGGLIGGALTRVPGSSTVFLGGIISYANSAKTKLLGVPKDIVSKHGAVSEDVAIRMAIGARDALGSDISVAVTGVAGPGGGTDAKPVGLVWIGVAGLTAAAHRHHFEGDRDAVRAATVEVALGHLHRALQAQAGDIG